MRNHRVAGQRWSCDYSEKVFLVNTPDTCATRECENREMGIRRDPESKARNPWRITKLPPAAPPVARNSHSRPASRYTWPHGALTNIRK